MKHIEKCGHPLEVKCCETPDQRNCMQTCNKILKCGHPCKNVCSKDCTEKCYVEVESKVRPECGHAVYIPCFMQNKSEYNIIALNYMGKKVIALNNEE